MLSSVISILATVIAFATSHALPYSSYSDPIAIRYPGHPYHLAPRAAAERQMWYVQSIYAGLGDVATKGPDEGHMIFPVDSAIYFTGTATDGPLMINLISYDGSLAVQVYEWPVSSSGQVPNYAGSSTSIVQRNFLIGNTTLTNLEIWNPTGSGNNSTNTTSIASSTGHASTGTAQGTGTAYSSGRLRTFTSSNSTSLQRPTGTAASQSTGSAFSSGGSYGTGAGYSSGRLRTSTSSNSTSLQSPTQTAASQSTGSAFSSGSILGTGTGYSSGRSLMSTSTATSHYNAPTSVTKLKKRQVDTTLTAGKIAQIVSEIEDADEAVWAKEFLTEAMIKMNAGLTPPAEVVEAQSLQEDYWEGTSSFDEPVVTDKTMFYNIKDGDVKLWALANLDDDEPLKLLPGNPAVKPKVVFVPDGQVGELDIVDNVPRTLETIYEEEEYNTEISTTDEGSDAAKIAGTDDAITPIGGDANVGDAGSTLSVTQTDGKLSLTTSLASDVAKVLGVAAIAVGIAFVVVDFIDGHYLAGALAIASVVAGAAAIALTYVAIPFAVVLADILGPLAILLAILPGLFTHVNPKPPANNGTDIIQWSFFGDYTMTGNEQCQKGTPATKSSPGTPPSPGCQAVYGAGTLAVALKLTNYEATVLSVWANDGYAISIPNLAAKMCIMDDTEKNQCSNAPFQVDCKNRLGQSGPHGETIGGTGFTNCDSPTYNVQLNLISLPILNVTADKIEPRIIGGPNAVSNADCKIVQFPGAQQFPKYNLTLNGLPSGIACGLQNAWNIGGTAVPFDCGNDCTPGAVVSSGENSTTGGNGAVVDAPPATPFVIPSGNDYVCLQDGTATDDFCLPPLKYDSQGGKAFDIWKVKSANIPAGFTLETYYQVQPEGRGASRVIDVKATLSPGQSQKELNEAMIGIHQNLYNAASFTISGPNPAGPLVCLFDGTQYNGNALCLGPGGTNLTSDWQNTAQSAKMWGAKATFYPEFYGNDGGQLQNGDIPDLSGLKYGTNQDLSKVCGNVPFPKRYEADKTFIIQKTYGLLIQAAD